MLDTAYEPNHLPYYYPNPNPNTKEDNRYRATVVKYNPDARTYPFLLHFELDGVLLDVSLPEPTVKLLEGRYLTLSPTANVHAVC